MAGKEEFYYGSGFGFDPTYGLKEDYGESFLGFDYRVPASNIGVPSNPIGSNILKNVSDRISTGVKTIEVSGFNIQEAGRGGLGIKGMDAVPKQQWKEINRLKKLTGIDLTFHAPIFEVTGFGRQTWTPQQRERVEREMISTVRRAHEMDPDGNLVVTFHSSNGLPEPETVIVKENGETELKSFLVVNESDGSFQNVAEQVNYLRKENKFEPDELLRKYNEEGWLRQLQQVNHRAHQGVEILDRTLKDNSPEEKKNILKAYKEFGQGEEPEVLKEFNDKQKQWLNHQLGNITHGDIYLRDAYQEFQNLFNTAYKIAKKNDSTEDIKKLDKFRDELAPRISQIEKDPSKVEMLGDELVRGVNLLRTIDPPKTLRPLREWAIEQASTSFANTAFDAYKQFKNSAPIISIENPPAGDGLSKAEDLRELVDATRKRFIEKAKTELRMSEEDAKKQAEKLIGVTWDVGHINMLRGKGYSEKQIIEQTAQIAPLVKHVHLSDNFGLDHTELPMGMGNVPTKEMLDLIHKYNKQVKKIAETGDWLSQTGLNQKSPVRQTLEVFGSPAYAGNMGPYWNQLGGVANGYFSGIGATNPDIHHALYGAGFTNLPVDFGGQMAGRSRASGAPIE